MLKTCFECLVGTNNNAVDNDTYGTRLNGHSQTTMWSTGENEEIFKIARPLKINDVISLNGDLLENRDKLILKLKSGTPPRGNEDFILQIEVDFLNDNIKITTNNSGQENSNTQNHSGIPKDSKFSLSLQFREYDNGFDDKILTHIYIGGSSVDITALDINLFENITFFTLNNGNIKVTELTFTYA